MAYRGKVSRGCETCRKRKIKCDQIQPSCTQCIKGRWKCPGYPELSDLLFRDESVTTVRKYKAREAYKRQERAVTGNYSTLARQNTTPPSTVPWSLVLSVQSRATNYFFSNHVREESPRMRGHFEYLPSLYRLSESDKHLSTVIQAVALATFANTVRSREILQESLQSYLRALRLTTAVLQSPELAAKDATLVAVLLLATFETITCKDQSSLNSCIKHCNGGIAILKLRGTQQFQNPTSLQIFMQVTSAIIVTCLQRELPIPPTIIDLRIAASEHLDTNDPPWRIIEIMIQFAKFRAQIKDLVLTDPGTIINDALLIDNDIVSLCMSMPPDWQYEVVVADGFPEQVYEGYYHVYSDTWMAQWWNYLRICRIFLHETIRDHIVKCSLSSVEHCMQYQLSTTLVNLRSSEICATVPQIGGFSLSGDSHQVDAPGVWYLIWPIFIIGSLAQTPSEQKFWINDRLRVFGHASGIHQAIAAAETLERGEKIHVWSSSRQKKIDLDGWTAIPSQESMLCL